MAKVFGSEFEFKGGVFGAANVIVQLGSVTTASGALVQQVNLNFAQQINQIKELTSSSDIREIYYVVGSPQGNATLNRICTNKTGIEAISKLGEVQSATKDRQITITYDPSKRTLAPAGDSGLAGLGKPEKFDLKAGGVFTQSVAYSMSVADFQLMEQAQFQFTHLEYN